MAKIAEMNVIHKDGSWFVNRALFRFVDSTDPENLVYFEPGVPTKVRVTAWMKQQELIVASPDPMDSDEPIPSVIVPTDNTVIPANTETGELAPGAAPGIQKTAAEPVAEQPKKK